MINKTESLKASIRGLESGNNFIKIQELLTNIEGYTLVKTNYVIDLTDDSNCLDCLKSTGVDNWDGYDEAREMYYDEE